MLFKQFWFLVLSVTSLNELSWAVKVSAFSSIKELCSRLHEIVDESLEISLDVGATSLIYEVFYLIYFVHFPSSKIVICLDSDSSFLLNSVVSLCVTESGWMYKHSEDCPGIWYLVSYFCWFPWCHKLLTLNLKMKSIPMN